MFEEISRITLSISNGKMFRIHRALFRISAIVHEELMDQSLNLKVDLQMRFLGVELRLTTAED